MSIVFAANLGGLWDGLMQFVSNVSSWAGNLLVAHGGNILLASLGLLVAYLAWGEVQLGRVDRMAAKNRRRKNVDGIDRQDREIEKKRQELDRLGDLPGQYAHDRHNLELDAHSAQESANAAKVKVWDARKDWAEAIHRLEQAGFLWGDLIVDPRQFERPELRELKRSGYREATPREGAKIQAGSKAGPPPSPPNPVQEELGRLTKALRKYQRKVLAQQLRDEQRLANAKPKPSARDSLPTGRWPLGNLLGRWRSRVKSVEPQRSRGSGSEDAGAARPRR